MSLAGDYPQADVYIQQVRAIERGGGTVRTRPAASREEALRARDVRRIVDQVRVALPMAIGDVPAAWPDPSRCVNCGRSFTEHPFGWLCRSVYTSKGRIDYYRCLGGCAALAGPTLGRDVTA